MDENHENQMEQKNRPSEDSSLAINEVQLILSEKRTALSVLRTGISVFVLPLSVLSVLVATSRYYEIPQVMHFLLPLLLICAGLVFLGSYLIVHAIIRIHRYDRLIRIIKQKNSLIAELID
jgi:hypothetical protein